MGQRILRTKQLFIGDGSSIQNGMLRIDEEGEIVEVGSNLTAEASSVEDFEGALCPGLVNAHCHLELSHLHGKIDKHGGLHEFIPSLQRQREIPLEEINETIQKWDERMQKEGIVAVGDISNSNHSLLTKKQSSIHYHSFIELFGLRPAKADEIHQKGESLKKEYLENGLAASLSPHSPYSVSDSLFQLIANTEKKGPISIHNQESEGEIALFKKGSGPLKETLLNFGNKVEDLEHNSDNPLQHLLQYSDPQIKWQLVHNTFTTEKDIQMAEEMHPQLYWCFCPSANLYIENRLPKILQFVEAGVKCTLGTDSLASNDQLSILEEIKIIQKNYPSIKTETLLGWACKNGAALLEQKELGEFKVGKRCGINQIIQIDEDGQLRENSEIRVIC